MTQSRDRTIRVVSHFDGAREHAAPADRLQHVRSAAEAFREELLAGPKVRFFASYDLIKVPYPTKYALRDACSLPAPMVHILNRLFVVQFDTDDGIKTLLAEPLDRVGNAETPFFKRLAQPLGGAQSLIAKRLWPALGSVEDVLAELGLRPEDVDYLTYDHLHTQDLRRWLGSHDRSPFFANAKLLVTRQEWLSAKGVLPIDAQWYCPNGLRGIDDSRVEFFDRDIVLGGSVALMRTPGHTEGNHSIVVHTEDGLFVTSENGVSADSYAPARSKIPGLAKWARRTGSEVVLNGNTLESAVDQYISMVQEKTVAGPSRRNPDFPNVAPSSELDPHLLSPGLRPTFRVGRLRYGTPVSSAGLGRSAA